MYRVFDSLVFEDEVTDQVESGWRAEGGLDAAQTRSMMFLVCINFNLCAHILFHPTSTQVTTK